MLPLDKLERQDLNHRVSRQDNRRRDETDGGDASWRSAEIPWTVGSRISVRRLRLESFSILAFQHFRVQGLEQQVILESLHRELPGSRNLKRSGPLDPTH
jgi:hypothetical protein